jgi:hypothetical protein
MKLYPQTRTTKKIKSYNNKFGLNHLISISLNKEVDYFVDSPADYLYYHYYN